jgi:primosomal protein N' (replication factor Y)
MSFKAGTEQIEEELHKLVPGIRTLRMDGDTTTKKGSMDRIVSSFARHEADALIGTQMIVKGHDFAGVSLVGIMAADISLAGGDYRSGERTFELLTQAAGRAGRGDKDGNVVIQTYKPDHYSILRAADQDYEGFYNEEILYREISDYPPVSRMLAVLVSGKDEDETYMCALKLKTLCQTRGCGTVIGPGKAGIGRINDSHRFVFYIKNSDSELLNGVRDAMEEWMDASDDGVWGRVRVIFDFNPMNPF